MSVTFEAMLILTPSDFKAIEALNEALYRADNERHQQFKPIQMDGAGGSKYWTTDVYAACFNHLTPHDVEACVRDAPWRYPEWVLYIVERGDYHMPDHGDESPLSARTIAEIQAATNEAR
jgi:hypothetical protein